MKRLFYSDETWNIDDLQGALEGDPKIGEVYIEFKEKFTDKQIILTITISDPKERKKIIKNFNNLSNYIKSHPQWILKTINEYCTCYSETGSPVPLQLTSSSLQQQQLLQIEANQILNSDGADNHDHDRACMAPLAQHTAAHHFSVIAFVASSCAA